ncbi:MAG TPA: ATP-binding protein [Steroidobacteraceae bacterium]|nr:ATP-binding protein [Steroidobacteraceae bacterium]
MSITRESDRPRALATPLQRSIRSKILALVLGTSATALLLAGIAMLAHDVLIYRQTWATDLNTEAAILARSTAPALAFDDRPTTQRNLSALQAREAILAVGVYDSRGALYAQFQRVGTPSAPAQLPDLIGTRIAGERLELTYRIVQNGEFLGTIYLSARYDIAGRIRAYVTIFALVTLASMIAALILSNVLQRAITTPLEAMAATAGNVVEQRDYSQRVQQTSDDEIGVVVHAFNKMLDEVETRTRALEDSNRALKQEVLTRQEAEQALRASERLYRAIGESIDYGVWIADAEGRNTYASDSFLRLTGMTQEQCSTGGSGEALHPDDVQTTMAAWRECVRTGDSWYREYRIRGADGHYHPILARGVQIRVDGETTGWAGINLDIALIKQTEEALREADRRKDEFVATLAHELRNPLAPIRHAAKILDTPAADEAQRQWARDIISRQVQHMSLLLDDLLDVSRITRGRLELKKDRVTLESLVTAAVETARPLFDARGHHLKVQLPSAPVYLEVDPLRLSQALSNLLTNAAKYTDAGGRIAVTTTVTDEHLGIAVEDTGIGIQPSALAKVFEMFSQVESAVDRSQGGLGIGLALVKGLIALHGGTVEAMSQGPGLGSTFTILLPRSVIVEGGGVDREAASVQSEGNQKCRVLIADDNVDGAKSLAVLLEVTGYAVCVVHSGADALSVGMRERPEIYILDIGMPEMNGYETARRIRREAWGKHALLIAVTGWGQKDDKERARAAGFDHHFTKPVDLDALESLLAECARARSA